MAKNKKLSGLESLGGLVYSTESGRICPECNQPKDQCQCNQQEQVLGDGKVRIHRETKGRKGKGVTLIKGLPLTESELKVLAKDFKKLCGTGGAVKDGVVEIQGDQREKLLAELAKRGWQPKLAGG